LFTGKLEILRLLQILVLVDIGLYLFYYSLIYYSVLRPKV